MGVVTIKYTMQLFFWRCAWCEDVFMFALNIDRISSNQWNGWQVVCFSLDFVVPLYHLAGTSKI